MGQSYHLGLLCHPKANNLIQSMPMQNYNTSFSRLRNMKVEPKRKNWGEMG